MKFPSATELFHADPWPQKLSFLQGGALAEPSASLTTCRNPLEDTTFHPRILWPE